MESVIVWAKKIFSVVIFSNLLMYFVPDEKYQRYIKFVCMMILTWICISPVFSFISGDNNAKKITQDIFNTQSIASLKQEIKFSAKDAQGEMMTRYKEGIVKTVEQKALDYELYPSKTEVLIDSDEESTDYGAVQKINMEVTVKESACNIAEFKKDMAEYFDINISNVNIKLKY